MQIRVGKTRRTNQAAVAACLMLPALGVGLCEGSRGLVETRTFDLQYLEPGEAMQMVAPYVYTEREGAPGLVTGFTGGITVRETPEALDRIAEVLERYDRAKPGVRLRFQLIEANGFTDPDDRIAEVRGVLEELFRFEGYRLVTEAQMALVEGTSTAQSVQAGERGFRIRGEVRQVRGSGDRGSILLAVSLWPDTGSPQIETIMVVPVGQTIVLGSTQARGQPTMILTVRPEFVPLPDTTRE